MKIRMFFSFVVAILILTLVACSDDTDALLDDVTPNIHNETEQGEQTMSPSPTVELSSNEQQDVAKLYSPNGNYFIEGINVFGFQLTHDSVPEKRKIHIVDVDSGLVVWVFDLPGTMHHEPQFLWSPNSRYVSVTYGGQNWISALVVDTSDMSHHLLPGLDELIPLFPDYAPDFSQWGTNYFKPLRWKDETTIEVEFYWTFRVGDVNELGEAALLGNIPRIYLYNVQTSALSLACGNGNTDALQEPKAAVNIRKLLWRDIGEVEHLFGNQVDYELGMHKEIIFDTGVSVGVNDTRYIGVVGDASGAIEENEFFNRIMSIQINYEMSNGLFSFNFDGIDGASSYDDVVGVFGEEPLGIRYRESDPTTYDAVGAVFSYVYNVGEELFEVVRFFFDDSGKVVSIRLFT